MHINLEDSLAQVLQRISDVVWLSYLAVRIGYMLLVFYCPLSRIFHDHTAIPETYLL
jgi:hypothetical protein